ncbi:tRNA (adenosine(37)-N6)-threonylcarbamoyltransferase complex ATPase subunit type 1 TsaE [Christensenellaceae bacterium OttesenSCG-928-K19]|nr:tRNA (adenosine(37)-N6)-threonylcarbamoyltransferase complex ATPase subunit type 1 TsaE [Christensenellaceae bacterium OttesenSCG-928-K19]
MAVYTTNSEAETQDCARTFAKTLEQGSFVALNGDLGAGKTAFVKGIASGLGISDAVVSPTYTLLRVYESGRLPLYHYDVYRLEGEDELADIGFYDYAEGGGVCVCEWAERIAEELPIKRIDINIERLDEQKRKIIIEQVAE